VAGLGGIGILVWRPLSEINRAQKVAAILAREQQPFWLTGGSIALSNLGIVPPAQAMWWWPERIALVFVRHLTVRCSLDAFTGEVIWQDPALCAGRANEFCARRVSEILAGLLQTPPYRQLVKNFHDLARLESDLSLLDTLQAEAEAVLAQELRAAEQRVAELRKAQQKPPESRQTQADRKLDIPVQPRISPGAKASWDTLSSRRACARGDGVYDSDHRVAGSSLPGENQVWKPDETSKTHHFLRSGGQRPRRSRRLFFTRAHAHHRVWLRPQAHNCLLLHQVFG
jgi:hypothetical protein